MGTRASQWILYAIYRWIGNLQPPDGACESVWAQETQCDEEQSNRVPRVHCLQYVSI